MGYTPEENHMEAKNHPIEVRKIIFQIIMFRFHVNLSGSRSSFSEFHVNLSGSRSSFSEFHVNLSGSRSSFFVGEGRFRYFSPWVTPRKKITWNLKISQLKSGTSSSTPIMFRFHVNLSGSRSSSSWWFQPI